MRTKLAVVAVVTAMLLAGGGLLAHKSQAVTATTLDGPPVRVFMQVTGQKQGVIHGETLPSRATTPSLASGQIEVYALTSGVDAHVDAASGLPTGRRQHSPLAVTIDWSKASPQLYAALIENENLPHVVVSFYDVRGLKLQQYAKIVLTNAELTSMHEALPTQTGVMDLSPQDAAATHFRHMETLTFAYQKIEWASMTGSKLNSAAEDDWAAPAE